MKKKKNPLFRPLHFLLRNLAQKEVLLSVRLILLKVQKKQIPKLVLHHRENPKNIK